MPYRKWWTENNGIITCLLCPHLCTLAPGQSGMCGARSNVKGKLELPGYGRITAENSDPVEKKPLFHFYPGSSVYSLGFTGCNMFCPFCQNHAISRAAPDKGYYLSPQEAVLHAELSNSAFIAYTYTEPSIHFEYLIQTALLAKGKGIKSILVTNGMLNRAPAKELLSVMDAANIDLKSFSADYYRQTLKGRLSTVLDFITTSVEIGVWTELTTLVVPGDNDDMDLFKNEVDWISSVSNDIPLHISAYHPACNYTRSRTGNDTIMTYLNAAREKINYVYPGNTMLNTDTRCPECGKTVVARSFYKVQDFTVSGRCPDCGREIAGVFSA